MLASIVGFNIREDHIHRLALCPPPQISLCVVPECDDGAVRLVGGVTNSTGRLEVCANGLWGRVCNRFQYWGPDNARVVCRQLGFPTEGKQVDSSWVVTIKANFS